MPDTKYIVIFTCVIVLIAGGLLYYNKYHCTKSTFDINVNPLRGPEYKRATHACGNGAPSEGYGLNKEHYNNITVCDFIKEFEAKTVFAKNINQDPCDVISRQICEVLYQNQQQYFENMWSGIGECEMYQKEKCKECPKGLIKIEHD